MLLANHMNNSFKVVTILLVSFLPSVFSSKAQNKTVFPGEKFFVLEAQLPNGKPVIGSINKAYKNFNNKTAYPWCLKINIALESKNCTENGLPNKQESDIANRFEDQLLKEIKTLAIAHYIGHLYNDTFLDVYIYLDNPEKVQKYLQSQINKKGITRPIAYEIKKDIGWGTVASLIK